jgi:RimJ/RimL family protein N-acetyltransferase
MTKISTLPSSPVTANTIIGTVSLMDVRRPHDRAELGIVIGNPDYWSKGYRHEAIRLMCDYGYTFLNLHVIYLWYVSYNVRGRKCYEKQASSKPVASPKPASLTTSTTTMW